MMRVSSTGTPLSAMPNQWGEPTSAELIADRVTSDFSEDCWIWARAHNREGYPNAWNGTKVTAAYIMAYELRYGPVPAGLELDHTCKHKWCWNPLHLEAVTHAENCYRAGTYNIACTNGHLFNEENTYLAKQSHSDRLYQQCRACKREWIRRKRAMLAVV